MEYKLEGLKNGLKVLTIPVPSLTSATVMVWVKTGARNEQDKISGISHFLEHMAFKGGKKYPSAKAVSETIDAIGGEFNASTSKEWTQYYVRCRSENLETAFDVLSDMILVPLLKDDDILREKGVIIEEIGMYDDTPIKRVWDYFEQLIFQGHQLGKDIIGTRETVAGLKRNDFINYLNRHYYAENMLITVSGGINQPGIKKLSEKYFGGLKTKGVGKMVKKKVVQAKPRVCLHPKDIQQAHIVFGYPGDPLGGKNRYNDSVLNSILSGGMSSRLFTEVREKRGLAYAIKSEFDRFIDIGYYAGYAGTDPKKATEAVKVILDQLYGLALKKDPIKRAELKKAKEYIKGHLALSLEDTRGINGFFGYEQLMLGKVRTPKQVYDAVDKVAAEDVYRSARKVFRAKKLNLTIIGPYKSSKQFEKLLNG